MKRRQKRNMMLLGLILALHLIYILAGLGLRKAGIQLNLRWLFWNLGLAFMPVALAVPAYLLTSWRRHWGPISLGLAIGWLLFLPNACYMVTDLIHLQGSDSLGRLAADWRQRRLSAKLIRLGALDLYRRRDFNGAGRRFVFHLVNSSKRQVAQK